MSEKPDCDDSDDTPPATVMKLVSRKTAKRERIIAQNTQPDDKCDPFAMAALLAAAAEDESEAS